MSYDKDILNKLCLRHNIEIVELSTKLLRFHCPKMPEKSLMATISAFVEGFECEFIESPKNSTRNALLTSLKEIGFAGVLFPKGDILVIYSEINVADDHPIWNDLATIILNDGYFTGYEIKIGHKTISCKNKENNIPRDHRPSTDEITDLRITLGQEKDVLEIIKEL